MTVALRAARPTDAGPTGDILWASLDEAEFLPSAYSGAETIAFCGAMIDHGWMTVAEGATGIVGFVALNGNEVVALYVAPGMRQLGIGQRLLRHAKAKRSKLKLRAFAANDRACAFYEREGFAAVGHGDGADNDHDLPDVAYQWAREATA